MYVVVCIKLYNFEFIHLCVRAADLFSWNRELDSHRDALYQFYYICDHMTDFLITHYRFYDII